MNTLLFGSQVLNIYTYFMNSQLYLPKKFC